MNSSSTSLDRHKRITLLFLKHATLRKTRADEPSARAVARDLEDLGGPFVRAARMLSTRADLLPSCLLDALSALEERRFHEDDLEPEPLEVIEQVIEDELGKKIPRAFASFHPKPAGFSGIGQIHHAALHDGRHVLVRTQRPRLRQRIVKDLDTLAEIAAFIDHPSGRGEPARFSRLIDRLRVSFIRELDYRREESALADFREKIDASGKLRVPLVLHEYSSSRVLTTEFIDGSEIWEIPGTHHDDASRELAREFLGGYLDQMLQHGHIHPQANLENHLITPDGQLVITEASGAIRIGDASRLMLFHLLAGLCAREAAVTAEAVLRIGRPDSPGARPSPAGLTGEIEAALGHASLADRFRAVARAASLHDRPFPPELCRVADFFANLSTTTEAICPKFDFEGFVLSYLNRTAAETRENTIPFPSPSAA